MVARVRLRDATSTLRTITRIRARDASNTLRTITRIRARDANNVLRVVYDTTGASSFSLSASRLTVGGKGNGVATTVSTTITPTGGTAPYTHAWTLITSTNGTDPTANSPAAATTTFTQTNIAADDADTATFRDTVTDSASNTATIDIACTFTDISLV